MIRELPDRPSLRSHLRLVTPGGDDLALLAEDRTWLWQSAALRELLPRLDGTRTLEQLLTDANSGVSPPALIYLLQHLNDLGLLAEGNGDGGSTALPLWHALGVADPTEVARAEAAAVRIEAVAPAVGAVEFAEALACGGGTVTSGGADLIVALTDHYLHPALTPLNEAALTQGTPWMLCKLVGRTAWVGPVFHPGQTACLACLQERIRLNHPVEHYVAQSGGATATRETPVAAHPSLVRLAAAWAVQEAALWLAGRVDRLEGRLLSLAWTGSGLEVESHVVVRRPQCPVCGNPRRSDATGPIPLRERPTLATAGGYRTEPPEATLTRLRHQVSPITGVVTWLTDLARDPEGLIHCSAAGHNFAMGGDGVGWLRQSLRSQTGGKGTTPAQTRASAVGEAIERYCGVHRGDEPCIRASYRSLGSSAVHPRDCLQFSDSQYDRRDVLNADPNGGFFHRVPNRFPENLEIDWTPLWSLTHTRVRHLPTAYCYYAHPDAGRHFYCAADSNGCAAGTAIEEAILQGFLELVERDAAAIWWYNQVPRPAVDLTSFQLPYLERLTSRYRRDGRELWVLDLTADIPIPVFAAVSGRVAGPTADLLIGLGAHPDPEVALLRAVSELNQFLPAVNRSDARGNTLYAWPDDLAVRFWKTETLVTQPQLRFSPELRPRTRADFATPDRPDLFAALHGCLDMARERGWEVLVLDQSRPDIELSVVRVVVPGLRHFWRRLGSGRLYDVPVQLGWLATPTPEAALNPASIFF